MGINGLRYWDQNNTEEENWKKTISSNKFLEISPDNLIYFWDKKAAFSFSAELYRWFEQLREKFDNLTKKENVGLLKAFKEEPLRHIVDVMEAAEENYYHILTFTEFLEETKENIEDKRYWALWKIYEDMVFDHQLIKAGSVIFAPEGTENKRNGF